MALQAGVMSVTVEYAKDLKDKDWFGKQDPYAVLRVAGQTFRTKTHTDGGKNPVWNETFHINIINDNTIDMTVYDSDVGKDDVIGSAVINLAKAREQGSDCQQCPVRTKSGKQHGFVSVRLHFAKNTGFKAPVQAAPVAAGYPPAGYPPQGGPPGYPPPAGYPPQAPPPGYAPHGPPAGYPPAPQVPPAPHGYPPQAHPPGYPPQAPQPGYPPPAGYPPPYGYPPPGGYHPPAGYPAPYGAAAPPPPYGGGYGMAVHVSGVPPMHGGHYGKHKKHKKYKYKKRKGFFKW